MKGSKVANPVQWHEGMLLTPQHFQQSDLRWQAQTRHYLDISCPYYWGISRMEIDKVLLVSGRFRILNLDATLPDGTVIHLTPSHELEVDLTDSVDKVGRTPISVYLAVVSHKDDEPSVGGDFPRYRSIPGTPAVDDNTGMGEVMIPRLEPECRLIVSDSIPSRFIGIPLGRVFFQDDSYVLSQYAGPQLRVTLDSELGLMVSALTKKIREKVAYLADKMQSHAMSFMKNRLQETENIYRSLVSGLLELEALQSSQMNHPYRIYLSLCNAASHLVMLRFGQVPPTFQPYDHDNPVLSYEEVLGFANKMIDLIKETYTKITFDLDGRLFKRQLEKEWVRQELIICVRPKMGMSEKAMADWMDSAVIATESHARAASDKRILGAKRRLIESVDSLGLMAPKGSLLYAVEVDPEFINMEEVLHVFNASDDDASRPHELVLYV